MLFERGPVGCAAITAVDQVVSTDRYGTASHVKSHSGFVVGQNRSSSFDSTAGDTGACPFATLENVTRETPTAAAMAAIVGNGGCLVNPAASNASREVTYTFPCNRKGGLSVVDNGAPSGRESGTTLPYTP